jgi:hypothetical protein
VSENDPKPSPLEYDRTSLVVTRQLRWLFALTLLNTVLLGAVVVGPQLSQFAKQQWQQWQKNRELKARQAQLKATVEQCLAYTAPPDFVVYEESPDRIAALLAGGLGYRSRLDSSAPANYRPPAVAPVPAPARTFGSFFSPGTVFLHERFTPSGQRRLVYAVIRSDQRLPRTVEPLRGDKPLRWELQKQRELYVCAFDPDSLSAPSPRALVKAPLRMILGDERIPEFAFTGRDEPFEADAFAPEQQLRVFAGQPDANDRTRVTIGYELNDQPGVIDIRLTDDDIIVTPRTGSQAMQKGLPSWDFSPTTRPVRGKSP